MEIQFAISFMVYDIALNHGIGFIGSQDAEGNNPVSLLVILLPSVKKIKLQ